MNLFIYHFEKDKSESLELIKAYKYFIAKISPYSKHISQILIEIALEIRKKTKLSFDVVEYYFKKLMNIIFILN